MTKHSRFENAKRAAENVRLREIEAAWIGSLPPDVAESFTRAVAEARSRPPAPPPANMPPGTAPRPPRPGHEPRPPKEERKGRYRS